ncbi:hypothetical protein BV25DRAFT_1914787 [Artomyces pyxidatus]|uniref:Uncharacterized protein n=1 Tax=Artomyces pyxidatus TaxID=48021 RepID=A0ACB8T8A6_9AGAM|nr:hypothetical protein BV25DRAFT_1914787 [Artomyces pyxidatus]
MSNFTNEKDPLLPTRWTAQQIKQAIKPELFHRSTTVALSYLVRDIFMACIMAYGVYTLDGLVLMHFEADPSTRILGQVIRTLIWATYSWFQGLNVTGIWLLGHECVHGAFSSSRWICDVVGFTIHTSLGTPYFSWKHAHTMHHQLHADNIHSSEHGDAQARTEELWEAIEHSPISLLPSFAIQQIRELGTLFLSCFSSKVESQLVLFDYKHRLMTLLTDIGFAGLAYLLVLAVARFGALTVAGIYGVPWLIVSGWIGVATLIGHRAPGAGVLSTIDHDLLGWQGKFFLHNMAQCHLVHHLFPNMPFYNAPEATEQVRQLLGSDYPTSDAPIIELLWKI